MNLPTSEDFERLYKDPRTTALQQAPGELTGALSLADIVQQKQMAKQKALLDFQKELQEVKQKAKQQKAADLASHLATPITPSTPASTAVPASLGNVANVNPESGAVLDKGQDIAAADEAKRPEAFDAAAVAAEPKTAINDLLKARMATAKQSGQWKPYGTVEGKDGTLYSVETNPNGEFRQTPLPPGTQPNATLYPKVRMQQMVGYLNKDLVDSLSLRSAPESVKRVDNTLAGLVRFKPLEQYARDNGLTPQEITEISRNVDALVSATGRPTVAITRELLPHTLQQKFSSVDQFLNSKPSPQDYKEFLDRWEKLRSNETPALQDYLKQYRARIAATKGEFIRQQDQKLFNRSINAYGIKQEDVDKYGGLNERTGNPEPMYPTEMYGKGNPEDRLNELVGSGMSEEEAYQQLAQEGY